VFKLRHVCKENHLVSTRISQIWIWAAEKQTKDSVFDISRTRMDVRDVVWEYVDWMHLAQDRD
jgi:hypothetical protein